MPSLKREHDSGDAGRTPAGGLKRAKPNSPSKQDLRTRPQLISHAEDLADKLNDAKYQRKEIRMKLDASEAEASSLRGEVERKTEKISDLTLDKAALETKMKQSEKQSKDNAKFQADVIQKKCEQIQKLSADLATTKQHNAREKQEMTGKINDLKAALEHAKKLLAENDSRDKDGDIRDLTIELEDAHLMITKQQRQMEEAKASLAVQS